MGEEAKRPSWSRFAVPEQCEGYLSRPRLGARLGEYAALPLTVVVAPAGFGKTTLVGAFATGGSERVGWYGLSEPDADPVVFWRNFVGACEHALGRPLLAAEASTESGSAVLEASSPASMVTPAGYRAIDGLMAALGSVGEPVRVVLEDFHRVQYSQGVCALVNALLERAVPTLRLTVTSRCSLPLRVSRLSLSGRAGVIDERELRFTKQETAHLLSRARVPLQPEELDAVYRKLEGWPVGIRALVQCLRAGGSLGERADGAAFEQTLSQAEELWNDYVLEEVAAGMVEPMDRLALAASCLDTFTAAQMAYLAETVGRCCPDFLPPVQSSVSVERLVAEFIDYGICFGVINPAVQPNALVKSEPAYAFRPIVRAALQHRIAQRFAHAQREANRAAAQLCLEEGRYQQAAAYAYRARDFDAIRDIIVSQWRQAIHQDKMLPIVAWYELLPETYIERYPRLCLYQMPVLYMAGRFAQAHQRYRQAMALCKEGDDEFRALGAALRTLCLAVEGRAAESCEEARRTLRLTEGDKSLTHFRCMMFQVLAGDNVGHDLAFAKRAFQQAVAEGVDEDRNVACSALANLAQVNAMLGDFNAAMDNVRDATALYDDQLKDEAVAMLGTAYTALAIIYYMRGQLPEAQAQCERYLRQLDFSYVARNESHVRTVFACILRERGRVEESALQLKQAARALPAGIAECYVPLETLQLWQADQETKLALMKACRQSSSAGEAGEEQPESFAVKWLGFALRFVSAKASEAPSANGRMPSLEEAADLVAASEDQGRLTQVNARIAAAAVACCGRGADGGLEGQGEAGVEATQEADRLAAMADRACVVPEELDSRANRAAREDPMEETCAIAKAVVEERGDGSGKRLAVLWLSEALDLALDEGIVQPFLGAAPFIQPALRSLARSESAVQPLALDMHKRLSARVDASAAPSEDVVVSARELDVMRMVDAGLSANAIADKLFISRETVKKHLGNVYSKLGVHSRTQAAAVLRAKGLL